jgi:hypothetical protein
MGKDLSPQEREQIIGEIRKLKENSSLYSNECSEVLNFTPVLREYEEAKRRERKFGSDGLPRVQLKSSATMPYYPRDEI